jgi:hypothetical protein
MSELQIPSPLSRDEMKAGKTLSRLPTFLISSLAKVSSTSILGPACEKFHKH